MKIPAVGEHRGVGLHDGQDDDRLAAVRAEIDEVFELGHDPNALAAWAKRVDRSPESRLLAVALVEARFELAAEHREIRPRGIDMEELHAWTAGLDLTDWRDRDFYCCLGERALPGERQPVRRKTPL